MTSFWQWLLVGGGFGSLGVLATILFNTTGTINALRTFFAAHAAAARKQQSETQVASAIVVNEAMALVRTLSDQVKDQRSEIVSLEEQHRREASSLRDRVRNLETRVGELETELEDLRGENIRLKAQLYDQLHAHHQPAEAHITPIRGAAAPPSRPLPVKDATSVRQPPRARSRARPTRPHTSTSEEPDAGA